MSTTTFITENITADPSAVYACVFGRSFFLGVRFPAGIIPSDGWRAEMLAGGVASATVDFTNAWLDAQSL